MMDDSTFNFDCGCKVRILDKNIKDMDGLPSLNIDYYNLPLECKDTWNIIHQGYNKGIFQLEKHLGKTWGVNVKPTSIEELSAVISIIRPGVSQAYIGDKSLTQIYTDRKNGLEPVEYIHPSLESILKDTQGILLYQEEALSIAKELAGFNLNEADNLRKAIGHKLPEVMAKIEHEFIEGCKKAQIVDEQTATQVFDWIRESQRYSFNKCVHPDTLTITKSGYKKIKDLTFGDCVLSPCGYVKVLDRFDNGKKEIYRIIFADINKKTSDKTVSILCTLDHKFLCSDNICRSAKDIFYNNLNVQTYDNNLQQSSYQLHLYKISKIEYIGIHNTMDIEIDDDLHTFYACEPNTGANFVATSNSHGIAYGTIGYMTAWTKQHFPYHFYTAWLRYAKERLDPELEIREIVGECKTRNINIFGPEIIKLRDYYTSDVNLDKDGVHFGIRNIKGVGDNHIKEIIANIAVISGIRNKSIDKWSWSEFLFFLSKETNKTVFNGLIASGALDHLKLSRQRMLYEYDKFCLLTNKERDFIKSNFFNENLLEMLEKLMKSGINKRRLVTLNSIQKSIIDCPYSTKDDVNWIVDKERSLLGTPINYSKTIINTANVNCDIISFLLGKEENPIVSGEIISKKIVVCKRGKSIGKEMAFFEIEDETGVASCVCFPSNYAKYAREIYESNTVLIYGSRGDNNSIIVNKIEII